MEKKIWEIYPALADVVRRAHLEFGLTGNGHDFDHALRVGQMALVISDDPSIGRLAGAAGLCHNADRMLQLRSGIHRKHILSKSISGLVEPWISSEPNLGEAERLVVLDAVLRHEKLNDEGGIDSQAAVALKDADRLISLELDVVMRAGQFQPHLPAVDVVRLLDDSEARFFSPRSVLRNIHYCLKWAQSGGPESIRLPKARAMAKDRAELLKAYIDDVIRQRKEAGMVPYPQDFS